MSVKKTKATQYHESDQEVTFKLSHLNIRNIEKKADASLHGVLKGVVGDTAGEVSTAKGNLDISDIQDSFSTYEKAAAKTFLKACERELAKKIEELKNEPHNDTDVFV